MSEEIIIDGVNVAECKYCEVIHYTYPTEGFDIECYADYQNEMVDNCKGKTTCYYKQLKRLEKENEELKALKDTYLTCYKAKHNDIEGELFKLRKENEELKEKVERLDKMTGIFSARLCSKYRHALEEIKTALGEKYGMADIIKIREILNKVLESEGK